MKHNIIILSILALFLCSCKDKVDTYFIENDNICLRIKNKTIKEFKPINWQMSFCKDNKTFRINNDIMSDYYIIHCSELPKYKGQKIYCHLKWTTKNDIKEIPRFKMEVKKIDNNGQIWLWSKYRKIGVTFLYIK